MIKRASSDSPDSFVFVPEHMPNMMTFTLSAIAASFGLFEGSNNVKVDTRTVSVRYDGRRKTRI